MALEVQGSPGSQRRSEAAVPGRVSHGSGDLSISETSWAESCLTFDERNYGQLCQARVTPCLCQYKYTTSKQPRYCAMSNRALAAELTVDFCSQGASASFGCGLGYMQAAGNQVLVPWTTCTDSPLLLLGLLIFRGAMDYIMGQPGRDG